MKPRLRVYSTYAPQAGSTRVRIYDWLKHLGLDADAHQYLSLPTAGVKDVASRPIAVARAERSLRERASSRDNVLISREASPLSRGQVEERLLREARHGVLDMDDALFHDSSPHRRLFGGAAKFERAAAASDVFVAGSQYIAEWAATHARRVELIPSCVEPRDYRVSTGTAGEEPERMIWVGSASTEAYLVPLIDDLLRLHERRGARLRLVSSAQHNPALEPLQNMMDRVPWQFSTAVGELAQADVALAPLHDTLFARGKCAYKLLQYGAAGVPAVGSPVGANELALQRLDGIAVGREDSWYEAVTEVLDGSDARRAARSARARDAVEEHYSFRAWAETWKACVMPDA